MRARRAALAGRLTCYGVAVPPAIKPKLSTSELLPGVGVSLNVKAPQVAFNVVVLSPEGHEPEELYAGLRAVGFIPRPQPPQAKDGVRRSFGRDGSAMFGGWTIPERERFTAEARRTLRRFGFSFVPEIQQPADGQLI
jgi:hypothetical protein